MRTPPSLPQEITPDRATVRRLLTAALDAGRAMLSEPVAKAALAAYGIPTVPTEVAATPEAAAEIAEKILRGASADALPPTLVVKILSPDISHKSDVGGVRLDLASAAAVHEAAARTGQLHVASIGPHETGTSPGPSGSVGGDNCRKDA